MNKEKKTLLLDVDEVICFPSFLEAINEFLGVNYVIDDFSDYYIDEVAIPKERFDEFNKFIEKKNLYENPHVLPDAIEVIEKLNEVYDIYICSACINPFNVEASGMLFKNKYDFLIKLLPFIKPEHFIFTNSKHIFTADVMIDDRLSNFDNNITTKILFPSYHNKIVTEEELKEKNAIRAGYEWKHGWREIEKILLNDID